MQSWLKVLAEVPAPVITSVPLGHFGLHSKRFLSTGGFYSVNMWPFVLLIKICCDNTDTLVYLYAILEMKHLFKKCNLKDAFMQKVVPSVLTKSGIAVMIKQFGLY